MCALAAPARVRAEQSTPPAEDRDEEARGSRTRGDEHVHANYIPKPPPSAVDYIRKYEETEGKNIRVHEERKHRKLVAEDWMSQMQIPVFVAILYFIFQMPIFNTLLSKYLSALPIFREDGNLNLYGMVFKSAGFGLLYYGLEYALDYFV